MSPDCAPIPRPARRHRAAPGRRIAAVSATVAPMNGKLDVGGVFDATAVTAMVDKVFAGRVQFHDGDAELAPGISLHKVGGHTRGMQIVRVATERGWVVLGSDTAHFYANLEPGRPFPILDSLPEYIEAQRTALRLASSPQHFIPGHDPLVLARYPGARAGLEGVARLDLAPMMRTTSHD